MNILSTKSTMMVQQPEKNEELRMQYDLAQKQYDLCKDGFNIVEKAIDVYNESQHIKRDIAMIQEKTTVQLANIAAKFTLCETALKETFGERSKALQKHYEVLETALNSSDRDMVIHALSGISSIVTENPLSNFESLLAAWNDNSKPLELDF